MHMKVKVTQSCPTLCDPGVKPKPSALQADSLSAESPHRIPRILTWVACPEDLPDPGIERVGLPHCRQILYQLSYQGSPNTYIFTYIIFVNWILKKVHAVSQICFKYEYAKCLKMNFF